MKQGLLIVCGMVMMLLIFLMQFGFIFLMLAMLPSVVAWFIDRDPNKPAFRIVGACNLAATLPSLMPLIKAAMHMEHYDISAAHRRPDGLAARL